MKNASRLTALEPYLMLAGVALLGGCGPQGRAPLVALPIEVTAVTVTPRDVPVNFEFVGQTESSRLVEIRARVDGYLQKKFYAEGYVVREGAPLFQIDPRPLEAALQSASAVVQQKESALLNARQTRERLNQLVAENAVSRKDFQDAIAAETSAAAALEATQSDRLRAKMNLEYARISSPVTGLAGKSNQAEGSYISPGANGLLTTVAQVDPIWVNFSISENEWLRYRDEGKKGTLRFPKDDNFDVEMILADGRVLPTRGKLNFASPSVDPQTGTYAIRAAFANANLEVRPGQFVRVRVTGATRPGAMLVPQRAVMQGQTGKFLYVVGKEGKAEIRPVEVGDWYGDDWFISAGLTGGERVVVGGIVKVQPGAVLKVATAAAQAPAAPAGNPGKAASKSERK